TSTRPWAAAGSISLTRGQLPRARSRSPSACVPSRCFDGPMIDLRFMRVLAASAMLAAAGVSSAQLAPPLPAPSATPSKEATKSTDLATRLGEVRATLARLEQPNAAEGSPRGTPDAEIGERIRLL